MDLGKPGENSTMIRMAVALRFAFDCVKNVLLDTITIVFIPEQALSCKQKHCSAVHATTVVRIFSIVKNDNTKDK